MENKAADMIREIKAIKEENDDITYTAIMEQMEKQDRKTVPSLSSVRRVFRSGSEARASGINFEEILLPIYNAVLELDKQPRKKSERDMEIVALKSVLRVQAEEIDRMMELNAHLQARVEFLVSQVDKKDALIQKLLERAL